MDVANVQLPERPKELGCGTKGCAYVVNNKLALKITKDPSEAAVAKLLEGKKKRIPGLYRIFGVYEPDSPYPRSSEKLYFIIMERLKINKNRLKKLEDDLRNLAHDFNNLPDHSYNIHISGAGNDSDISQKAIDKFFEVLPELIKGAETSITSKVADMRSLLNGFLSLKKLGISYGDYYWMNSAVNSLNEAVLIDFGYSRGASGGKYSSFSPINSADINKKSNYVGKYKEIGPERATGKGYELVLHSRRQEWLKDGKLHREDGPAYVQDNGIKEWWLNNKLLDKKWFINHPSKIAKMKALELFGPDGLARLGITKKK